MDISNRKWTDEQLQDTVKEVLSSYPTGKGVNLEEAVQYQKSHAGKWAASLYEKAKKEGRILAQPRAGVASIEEMIELLQYLQDEGGSDIVPMTPDTYTRRLQYDRAKAGLEQSIQRGRSVLNGFPVVEHGVPGCRRVVESVRVPVSGRCGTGMAGLANTIAFASGVSEIVAGGVSFNFSCDFLPFDRVIREWQYIYRLVGWFEERGVPIVLEYDSTAGASMINPPSLAIVINLIDVLLAAEQGVKHHLVTHFLNNSFVQDLATLRVMGKLTRDYLNQFGHTGSVVLQSANEWHGVYPEDTARGFGTISVSAVIASFGKVAKIMVRSVEEGINIPSKEANAASVRATKQVLSFMRGQEFPPSIEVDAEAIRIESAVRSIMDRILELGGGDIAVGTLRAIGAGVVDIPFSPNKACAGKVITVKDRAGASRFLEVGNLPLPREIVEYDRERIAERKAVEHYADEQDLVVCDIYPPTL